MSTVKIWFTAKNITECFFLFSFKTKKCIKIYTCFLSSQFEVFLRSYCIIDSRLCLLYFGSIFFTFRFWSTILCSTWCWNIDLIKWIPCAAALSSLWCWFFCCLDLFELIFWTTVFSPVLFYFKPRSEPASLNCTFGSKLPCLVFFYTVKIIIAFWPQIWFGIDSIF